MPPLRLGAIGLAARDAAYIRALLRLYSHTARLAWVFTDQPPYHAVVTDRVARAADPEWFAQFAGPVLTLVAPPGPPEADTVAYPIHAEQLLAWLTRRQHAPLAPTAAAAPASAAPLAPEAAAPVRGAALPAAGERRYKLHGWPSTALLQGNELHLKIATLLSSADLSTARLSTLTGRPEKDVRRFLIALHRAGLLVEAVADGSAPDQPEAAAATVGTGLLASLGRHLGW